MNAKSVVTLLSVHLYTHGVNSFPSSVYLWIAHMPSILLSMHTCVHTFGLAPSLRRAEMEVISPLRQANVNAV